MPKWEEEFRLKLYNVYATVFSLSKYSNKQLKEKEDIMVNYIFSLLISEREKVIKEIEKIFNRYFPDIDKNTEVIAFLQMLKEIKSLLNSMKI